ncbi:nose resistant to fluoxetine protein 6-like [Belonocnema kinseyi]|uniref:nose resistant to fluoxetine protein 6-like n=1 Tax=Belonocnema kinseyi TaxID=2817044 RepID=UPI00143D9A42|nr:nose resistant to fluoxetine protein 6-like [Belonocnema kinseyi]
MLGGIMKSAYLLTRKIKMVDASSKFPVGILEGNIVDLGMYDECISIIGNFSTAKNEGKHCMYTLDIVNAGNVIFNPKFAMCIPSTCDIENVNSIINGVNQLIHKKGIISQDFNIKVNYATCSNLDFEKWSTGSMIAMTVIVLLIIFLLFCTVLEFSHNWIKENNIDNKIIPILAQFSVFNSSLRILSTKANSGSITSIHGIRALSILWIVYGHETFFGFMSSYVNLLDFVDWSTSWKCIYLIMGVYAVDTFLLLSGFLLSYLFLKRMSQGASFNLFEYYFHRYIRLTPAVAALMVIVIYIAPHLGSGPRWESDIVANVTSQCEYSWWKYLLYVQNYAGDEPGENLMCMGHLWYLAVDMQLFWLSPFILYPLSKKPIVGLIFLGAFFIASVVTPGVITATNGLSFNNLAIKLGHSVMMKSSTKLYLVTHCRAGPWFFGILFGYIMFKITSKPKRHVLIFGWITATVCFVFCTCGFLIILQKNYEYDALFESILASFARTIWSAGVAWIIYICHHGYGGILNMFLSFPIFLPISRISYSIYLLHFVVLNLKSGAMRLPGYFSDFTVFEGFLGDVSLCIFLSFFFCIVFESPILILEKMVFGKKRDKSGSQNQIPTNGESKTLDFQNQIKFDNVFENISGNKAENKFQNVADNGSFDKIEKGNTIVDANTNELTTNL